MSGQTPQHAFTVPTPPAENCKIKVTTEAIQALRDTIPVSREDAMRWVDPSFDLAAQRAYNAIGCPSLSNMANGWAIFTAMARLIPQA